MRSFEGLLFLFALHAGILLSGYWLAAQWEDATPGERLAVAALAGIACLLLLVAAVNFFLPLSGLGALMCLIPAAGSLAHARTRTVLWIDVRRLLGARTSQMVAVLYLVFLVLLLRPALVDGQTLYYDGTSNHDGFLWVSCGEYFQRHNYIDPAVENPTQPWLNTAGSGVGWHPGWGHMGGEGLLALASSLAFTGALNTYLYTTAALYLPWTAAVFLVAVTFYRRPLSAGALAALVTLQPIFIFFHANSNLTNLAGIITGATVVIGTEMALRAETGRRRAGWCVVLALGLHGLYACYPELTPFILLPCGLLWMRTWAIRPPAAARGPALAVSLAFLAGTVVNPATSIRAWNGFAQSFRTAREDQAWVSHFRELHLAEYVPGWATLSTSAAMHLGVVLGSALTLVLLAGGLLCWWRARDRFGLAVTLSGSLTLLLYTYLTGFTYGYQKTTQFGAIFIAAIVPVALFDTHLDFLKQPGWRRWLAAASLGSILTFQAVAVAQNLREISLWSRDKILSLDWLDLRDASRTSLRDAPVIVEAASFRMRFFHGMWCSHFLADSRIYFAERGGDKGGYLSSTLFESAMPPGPPPAVLVGRNWAETFDANSPRLLSGREFALLREANRVLKMEGVYPLNGVPEHCSPHASFTIVPHSAARLRITLTPRLARNWPTASWDVTCQAGNGPGIQLTASGAPPWQFEVPLAAQLPNAIAFATVAPAGNTEALPFSIQVLKIESVP
jgi:hypothetical protein